MTVPTTLPPNPPPPHPPPPPTSHLPPFLISPRLPEKKLRSASSALRPDSEGVASCNQALQSSQRSRQKPGRAAESQRAEAEDETKRPHGIKRMAALPLRDMRNGSGSPWSSIRQMYYSGLGACARVGGGKSAVDKIHIKPWWLFIYSRLVSDKSGAKAFPHSHTSHK